MASIDKPLPGDLSSSQSLDPQTSTTEITPETLAMEPNEKQETLTHQEIYQGALRCYIAGMGTTGVMGTLMAVGTVGTASKAAAIAAMGKLLVAGGLVGTPGWILLVATSLVALIGLYVMVSQYQKMKMEKDPNLPDIQKHILIGFAAAGLGAAATLAPGGAAIGIAHAAGATTATAAAAGAASTCIGGSIGMAGFISDARFGKDIRYEPEDEGSIEQEKDVKQEHEVIE